MALALALGLLTTAANLVGSTLAVMDKSPSRKWMSNSLAFGGGFILAAALIEMAPQAMAGGEHMPAFIACGFLLLYFLEHIGNVHMHSLPGNGHHDSHQGGVPYEALGQGYVASSAVTPRLGLSTFAAFNVHDFVDGLAIGAAMVTNQAIGVLVFMGVLMHELPAGFAVASIMRGAGWNRLAALMAGVSIGVVTLIGIAIPFLIDGVSDTLTNVFVALATGTFIYLGASILIPAAETGGYRWAFIYVGVGFGGFYLSARIVDSLLGT